MKQPGFLEGVVVAVVLSVLCSAFALILTPLFGRSGAMYLLVTGIGFVYLIYLLARSRERVGRMTTVLLWLIITGIAGFAGLHWLLLGLLQAGIIWLVRSLYFYSSVLSALLDLGLTALSVIVAFWVATYSESLFLGAWTFFLLQALFVGIPKQQRTTSQTQQDETFQQAFHSAEAAVRKLSAWH